jgi:hypothetical protein
MELVLNLAWFIIATASYALLFRRLARHSGELAGGPSRCQCVVALGCVLAILFPVISLTDDLHDMQATLEESSSSCVVMKRVGVNRQLTPVCTPHHLIYIVFSIGATIGWAAFGNPATHDIVRPSPGMALISPGRAPPPFFATQIT